MKNKGNAFKQALLTIRKLKPGAKKTAAIDAAAKKFKTSAKTIYRELQKKPSLIGVRDQRSDSGNDRVKISKKELSLFDEKLQAGKTLQQARTEIEAELHIKISNNKLNKISAQLKKKQISDNSNFGSEVKALITKALKVEEIGFDKIVNVAVKFGDKKIIVPFKKNDIEQIRDIAAARVNMSNFASKYKLPLDDNRLLRRQLKYMVSEQIQLAMETASLNDINTLTQIANRLDDTIKNITPDFKLVINLIQRYYNSGADAELIQSLLETIDEELNG